MTPLFKSRTFWLPFPGQHNTWLDGFSLLICTGLLQWYGATCISLSTSYNADLIGSSFTFGSVFSDFYSFLKTQLKCYILFCLFFCVGSPHLWSHSHLPTLPVSPWYSTLISTCRAQALVVGYLLLFILWPLYLAELSSNNKYSVDICCLTVWNKRHTSLEK